VLASRHEADPAFRLRPGDPGVRTRVVEASDPEGPGRAGAARALGDPVPPAAELADRQARRARVRPDARGAPAPAARGAASRSRRAADALSCSRCGGQGKMAPP